MKTCKTCKFNDKYNFCEKLVIDMKWIYIDDKRIKSYYLDDKKNDDVRSQFITNDNFGCKHHLHEDL